VSKPNADVAAAMVVGALGLPFVLAIGLYVIGSQAFIASLIWAWYATPLGLPALGWKTWAGVACLKATLFQGRSKPADKEAGGWAGFAYLLAPWFTLLLAWWLK